MVPEDESLTEAVNTKYATPTQIIRWKANGDRVICANPEMRASPNLGRSNCFQPAVPWGAGLFVLKGQFMALCEPLMALLEATNDTYGDEDASHIAGGKEDSKEGLNVESAKVVQRLLDLQLDIRRVVTSIDDRLCELEDIGIFVDRECLTQDVVATGHGILGDLVTLMEERRELIEAARAGKPRIRVPARSSASSVVHFPIWRE